MDVIFVSALMRNHALPLVPRLASAAACSVNVDSRKMLMDVIFVSALMQNRAPLLVPRLA
jgi:hypothetical protein